MTDKKSRERVRSLAIDPDPATRTREVPLAGLLGQAAELARDLEDEASRLRARAHALEAANTQLRAQLAANGALHAALERIEALEEERELLASKATEAAAVSTRSVAQCSAIEADLANMANLYIAADQLHSTLDLPRVLQHVTELLEQFVGSREHAIYFADDGAGTLAPLAAYGVAKESLPVLSTRPGEGPEAGARAVEQALLTGIAVFDAELDACGVERPVACVPLKLDGRAVGVIAVYRLLAQKDALSASDRELFRMLGAHAATAITGALLWQRAGRALPRP